MAQLCDDCGALYDNGEEHTCPELSAQEQLEELQELYEKLQKRVETLEGCVKDLYIHSIRWEV